MSESQRIDPPSLSKTNPCIFQNSNCPRTAVFHRLAIEPLTFSDGTYLPEGTFITVAAASNLLDPEITPDPETFDAFRTYRKRLEPGESTPHQYATVDKDHMHFGHGKARQSRTISLL